MALAFQIRIDHRHDTCRGRGVDPFDKKYGVMGKWSPAAEMDFRQTDGLRKWSPKMAVVTLIVGLCASGKSWLAERMKEEDETLEVLDEGFPAPATGLSPQKYAKLREYLIEGKDCAVVEATLFYEPLRQEAIEALDGVSDLEIKWECFEIDLAAANHNCLHRENKGDGPGHAALNTRWVTAVPCTYPEGANIRPIRRIPAS
jgi:hypothetical protein